MLLLMKLKQNERSGMDRNDVADLLFSQARDVYNDTAADTEAYLVEPDEFQDADEAVDLVDGAEDPEAILRMARSWNQEIAADFEHALNRAEAAVKCTTDPKGGARRQWLTCPSDCVYELKKAAMALDNSFYDFAERALLVNEHGYFTTRLTDEELADIEAHPGDYASITVYPK